MQWVPGALSFGVRRPEREAAHSPPYSAEVKVHGAIPPLPRYAFMAWCLVKHRDFTFNTFKHVFRLQKLFQLQFMEEGILNNVSHRSSSQDMGYGNTARPTHFLCIQRPTSKLLCSYFITLRQTAKVALFDRNYLVTKSGERI
jgi:hypothetical protein